MNAGYAVITQIYRRGAENAEAGRKGFKLRVSALGEQPAAGR